MRQRSRFSKTLLCLPLKVTLDDGIYVSAAAAAAVVPSVVGIEPPPPILRTLQSAADRPPENTCTASFKPMDRDNCTKEVSIQQEIYDIIG